MLSKLKKVVWGSVPLTIIEQKRAAWASAPGSSTNSSKVSCEPVVRVWIRVRALRPLF